MFRPVPLVLVLLLVASPAARAAQLSVSPVAPVAGRILDVATLEPIVSARVSVTPAAPATGGPQTFSPPPRPLVAVTNADGVFVIADVPHGRWRLEVQKTGFFVAGETPPGRVIDVVGSVTVPDIHLDRGGAIEGRVIDGNGNVLGDVLVTAAPRRAPNEAPRSTVRIPAAQTNDLGEFRLAGLPPGEYHLFAAPRIAPATSFAPTPSASVYLQTYYPGVPDIASATPLTVTRGLTTTTLDLRLLSAAAFQVSGIAVDATGAPAPGAAVVLLPASPTRTITPINATAQADGTFRIVNVPSGNYRINASMPMVPGLAGASTGAPGTAVARRPPLVEVRVDNTDVTGVQVTVQPR